MPETDLRAHIVVRHATVLAEPSVPSANWRLTPEGRSAAESLGNRLHHADLGITSVVASAETKAIETARAITDALGLDDVGVDARLDEVERPWTDDHDTYRALVACYLDDVVADGWEPPGDVVSRLEASVVATASAAVGPAVFVGHGIALTLWARTIVPALDAIAHWRDLEYPDAWIVMPAQNRIERMAEATPVP